MIVRPKNDDFTRDYNEKYEPETDIECSICGYGIFYGEDISWDEDGQICHKYCLEGR